MDVPTDRREILAAGFKGLQEVDKLLDGQYAAVPELPGVYAVFRLNEAPPRFVARSAAARVKGEDPTLPVGALQASWVDTAMLFVSRAATLRTRVRQLVEFGHGKPVAHAQGRAIWQLADCDQLIVGYQLASDPKGAEAEWLAAFQARYGTLPFANAFK